MPRQSSDFQLYKIGSKARIDLRKLNDELSAELTQQIKANPIVTVIDYKMTDGTDIGLVVEFENKTVSWFFRQELNELSKDGTIVTAPKTYTETHEILQQSWGNKGLIDKTLKLNTYKVNKEIKDLIKPISFINWFLYSLKDVI